MKNLLDDPDVMQLYRSLQNNSYNDIDDFLTSNPVDDYNKQIAQPTIKPKLPNAKIWVDGVEVNDNLESDDYGL